MELTPTHKNKIAKFDAMTAAHKAGHPEVVLMIVNGQIGVRSRRSGEWPIRDYQREVPSGTVAVVYVDYTDRKPEYYIMPADELREILKEHYHAHLDAHGGQRPRSPESGNVGLSGPRRKFFGGLSGGPGLSGLIIAVGVLLGVVLGPFGSG